GSRWRGRRSRGVTVDRLEDPARMELGEEAGDDLLGVLRHVLDLLPQPGGELGGTRGAVRRLGEQLEHEGAHALDAGDRAVGQRPDPQVLPVPVADQGAQSVAGHGTLAWTKRPEPPAWSCPAAAGTNRALPAVSTWRPSSLWSSTSPSRPRRVRGPPPGTRWRVRKAPGGSASVVSDSSKSSTGA